MPKTPMKCASRARPPRAQTNEATTAPPSPAATPAAPPVSYPVPVAAPAPTPTLDTLIAVLAHAVDPTQRWTVEGWGHHLRHARHQVHAANSLAKHERDFPVGRDCAMALVIARCVDFGMTPEDARELVEERISERAKKVSAAATA